MAVNFLKRPTAVPSPQIIADGISGAVYTEWGTQTALYAGYWDWYDGTALDALTDDNLLKYPLKINPAAWIANKHGRGLYGEYSEDAPSLVQFGFKDEEGKTSEACKKAARIVNAVWDESNGADLQIENATISQVLGGCVYRVAWQPEKPNLTYKIRVNKVIPDYFAPVWDSDDQWTFPEVYVLYYITGDEAKYRYQIDVKNKPWVLYSEHWTNDKFEIKVDDVPLKGDEYSGENPFGFVPFVYIPHICRAGGNYGLSHIPGMEGLITEYNARLADRGDGVKNANFDRPVGRNIGRVKVQTLSKEMQILDIGSAIPGTAKGEPDLFYLEPNSVKGAAISREFTEDVWHQICNDTDTPPIAWGTDQVSQRSGMSMETLFWPLTSHIKAERVMHRIGLGIINRMILSILAQKGVGEVTEEMLTLKPRVKWAKIMPRDRESKVNEVVQRRTVKPPVMSLPNAVRQLSEGEDDEEELALIQQEIEEEQKKQEEQQVKQQEMQMETQRQNMQMKMQADAQKKADGAKEANPRQEK